MVFVRPAFALVVKGNGVRFVSYAFISTCKNGQIVHFWHHSGELFNFTVHFLASCFNAAFILFLTAIVCYHEASCSDLFLHGNRITALEFFVNPFFFWQAIGYPQNW